jgi:Xaa-Pro aminopeptidase
MVSPAERARRYAALRAMMEREGYAALLVPGNAEATQRGYLRYVSDWRLWGGKGFVVLPKEGDPILILGAGSQSNWAKSVDWIREVRAAQDMIDEVEAVIKQLGLANRRIGLPGLNHVLLHGDVVRLGRQLPGVTWVDATTPMDAIMAIKSTEELAAIRSTYNAIADAMEVLRQNFAPGRTERAVMAKAVYRLAELGCIDGIAHLGTETLPFFHPPTDRVITADDIIKVSLEFAGPEGYWIELAGIFSFKPPSDRLYRFYETTLSALCSMAATLKPGAVGGDITRAVEATYRDAGWQITGRALWDGHQIGLNVIRPPYGLIDDTHPFAEGMVINVHPGVTVDDDHLGIFLQDNLLVTPTGGKPVGDYTYQWHILPT